MVIRNKEKVRRWWDFRETIRVMNQMRADKERLIIEARGWEKRREVRAASEVL